MIIKIILDFYNIIDLLHIDLLYMDLLHMDL